MTGGPCTSFQCVSSDHVAAIDNILGSSALGSEFSEWTPTVSYTGKIGKQDNLIRVSHSPVLPAMRDYSMEMILNDINSSLNLDNLDEASDNRNGNIWGGAVNARSQGFCSASSSPTWGVIGNNERPQGFCRPNYTDYKQVPSLSSTGSVHLPAVNLGINTGATPSLESASSCSSVSAGSAGDLARRHNLNKVLSPPGFRSISLHKQWLENDCMQPRTSSNPELFYTEQNLDENRQPSEFLARSAHTGYPGRPYQPSFDPRQGSPFLSDHTLVTQVPVEHSAKPGKAQRPYQPSFDPRQDSHSPKPGKAHFSRNIHINQHPQDHEPYAMGTMGLQHGTSYSDQHYYHLPPNKQVLAEHELLSQAFPRIGFQQSGMYRHPPSTSISTLDANFVRPVTHMDYSHSHPLATVPHALPSIHVHSTTSVQALVGQIRRLSRDQMGCRLLQQALVEDGTVAASIIFQELLPYMAELMMDPFGNYLFQKLLDCITDKEKELLVRSIAPRLVQAALNLHGTRSVQKVIDIASTSGMMGDAAAIPEIIASRNRVAAMVSQALKPAASRLCIDSHGNHVMQRILSGFSPEHTLFIYECVTTSVGDVARHRHGCCVIQRCLDSHPHLHYITDDQVHATADLSVKAIVQSRRDLMNQICSGALRLMQDAYGNYVVQYVLDVCVGQPGEFQVIEAICETTLGRVSQLSIQKFSSNVIEKCLEKCSDKMRANYLKEISASETIKSLMNDPFGNYVVQRALGVSTHVQAVALVESMRPHLMGMKNSAPGRRIMGKILRRFPNFNIDGPIHDSDFQEADMSKPTCRVESSRDEIK